MVRQDILSSLNIASPKQQTQTESFLYRTERSNLDQINFYTVAENRILQEKCSKIKESAQDLIGKLDNIRSKSGTVINDELTRIDIQGRFTDENGCQCLNIQVQINAQRRKNESTTIAQVIVPENWYDMGVVLRYIKSALLVSLEMGVKVVIESTRKAASVKSRKRKSNREYDPSCSKSEKRKK